MLHAEDLEDAGDAEYAENVECLGSSVDDISHLFRARKLWKALCLQAAREADGGLQKSAEGCRIRVICDGAVEYA